MLNWKMNFLAQSALREGVHLLVFTPSGLNWHSENVCGLTYDAEKKKWKNIECAFPNIIYDRATFGAKEKEVGRFVRQRLNKEYEIPFINSKSYFDKWETHLVLSKASPVKNHLPDTSRYQHPFQIADFVDKYDSAYMKDSAGRLGRNIYKVQKAEDDLYTLNYQMKGVKCSEKLSVEKIHSFLVEDKFFEKKVIIQQGIDMAQLNDHPFDVRVLAQKKDMNAWEVVDKSLRVAAPGSIVTNISSGAKVGKFNQLIPSVFSDSASISNDMDELVINVCSQLEKTYGRLGELGIDIAIDKSGKTWLIEVNGKPSKLCIYHSGDLVLIDKACTNIARYAKELFELGNGKEDL